MLTSILENPSFSYTPPTQSPKEARPESSKATLGNVLTQALPDLVLLELDPQKGHSLHTSTSGRLLLLWFFVLFFETRSHLVAQAGLETHYVDQAVIRLPEILPPLSLLGIKVVCHHAWLRSSSYDFHTQDLVFCESGPQIMLTATLLDFDNRRVCLASSIEAFISLQQCGWSWE